MIYACIKFLQEWSTPLTVVNYFVLGTASGFTLAAAFSAWTAPHLTRPYAISAAILTLVGLATRSASLVRNARLKPKSTLQTAIGVRHPRIVQKAQGFMGGSFNTREFFHGKSRTFLRSVKWGFLFLGFVLPLALLLLATTLEPGVGLLGNRVRHPVSRLVGRAVVFLRPGKSSSESVLPDNFLKTAAGRSIAEQPTLAFRQHRAERYSR